MLFLHQYLRSFGRFIFSQRIQLETGHPSVAGVMIARLLACTLLVTVMSDAKPARNDIDHAAAMAAGFHPAGVSGKLTQHDYTDIAEIIYRTEGPMPQLDSPWPFTDADFARQDEHDDHDFYAAPRLVHHIDDGARAALSHYYRFLFVDAQRHPQDTAADTAAEPALPIAVLDLCSSWVSHFPEPRPRRHAARAHVALPPPVPLRRAVGLGLNRQELDANPRLTERVVLDLNAASRPVRRRTSILRNTTALALHGYCTAWYPG